jgi:amino acid adenylation domain-containing protein
MIMSELFEELHQHGVRVTNNNGKLNLKLPKELDIEVKSKLIKNKEEFKLFLESMFINDEAKQIKPRKPMENTLKASFAQQRLWFLDSLQGGSPEYNMPMVFKVEGLLNIDLMKDVLYTIIERHEILRTVYVTDGGETLQHIRSMSEFAFEIKVENLSHLTGDKLETQVNLFVEADIITPFELASDLMMRVSYVKKAAESGVIIFNMHHIVSDGWSMQMLFKEFFTLFEAYSQGQVNPLPALDIQYADYAHWQREYLAGGVLKSQLGYWEKQLDDLPVIHSLPLDYVRPKMKQHKGAGVSGKLPATTAKRLIAVAKEHKLTPFMLLHGALSLLLSRHSNSADIVIGAPVANRLQAELEPLIGFFVNSLILRANTNQDTLSDYFTHIRQLHLDALTNQDVPIDQLVERLKAPRSTSHSPLFQILISTNTDYGLNSASDIASFTLPGVDIEPYQSDVIRVKFDLDIYMTLTEQGVGLDWAYDVSLFSAQHIEQLNDHLCRLLEGLSQTIGQSTQTPHSLPLLSVGEIQHLVHDLNDTSMEYSKDKCIHELFEQQVADYPDNVAVVFEDRQLTYKQLNEKANQLAHYLKEHHRITPDTFVGLCVERSIEMVIGILGILKVGGAYVPLDPGYPQERQSYMLEDSALKLVLSQSHIQGVIPEFLGEVMLLDGLSDLHHSSHICNDYKVTNLTKVDTDLNSSNLAYLIYTSGSTGKPKGVMVEHGSLVNYQKHVASVYELLNSDSVLQFSNICFDLFVEEFFGALCHGARLVLRNEDSASGMEAFMSFCGENDVSVVSVPTAFWAEMIAQQKSCEYEHLRMVIVGGEALSMSTAKDHEKQFGSKVTLINSYGPTEATITAASYRVESVHFNDKIVPIGKANVNCHLFVLNDNLSLCPKGVVGELFIGGDGLARGYLNRPDLTKKQFIPNPFYDESTANSSPRLYRTGDLVRYLENGDLVFLGRTDDQVKIRGFRIELGEVETQLAQLEEVDSALVIAKELAGSKQLVGYIKPTIVLAEQEQGEVIKGMIGELKSRLPEFMVPRIIMVVEEWPLTPNGKVDRKALPAPDGSTLQGEYFAPETETEQVLVAIWAELLNIDVESVSIKANFFELGGHSLLTVRLLFLIHTHFEKACELSSLFNEPTIQSQASMLDSLQSGLGNTELLYKVTDCIAPKAGIIFIPGVASTAKDFTEIVMYLQQGDVDADVEIGIFRHKGLIAGEQCFGTIKENVNAFADCISSLPFKQITLVGHSFGGALAMGLANHLKARKYQIELVMLDTYFEQQKLCLSNKEQSTQNLDLDALDMPFYMKELYQHQSKLFKEYEPKMDLTLPTTMVFSKNSPFAQQQYIDYLDEKLSGQRMNYTSVDGDHFSMLKGKSAKLISAITTNTGRS